MEDIFLPSFLLPFTDSSCSIKAVILIEDPREETPEDQEAPDSKSQASDLTQIPVQKLGAAVVEDKPGEHLQGQMVPSGLPPAATTLPITANSTTTTTTAAAVVSKPNSKPASSKPRTKPNAVTKPRTKSKPAAVVVSLERTKTLSAGVTPSQVEAAITKEISSTEKKRSIKKKRVLSAGISPTPTSHTTPTETLLSTSTTKRIPNIAEELAKNRTDPKFLLHSFTEQRSADFKHVVDPAVTPTVSTAAKQVTPLLSTTSHSKPADSKTVTKKSRVRVSKPKSTSNKTTSGTSSSLKEVSAPSETPKVEVSTAHIIIEPKTARPLLGAQNVVSDPSSPADNTNKGNGVTATQSTGTTKNLSPSSVPIAKGLPGLRKSKSTMSSLQDSTPKIQASGSSGTTPTSKASGPQKAKKIKSTSALPSQGQQQQKQKQQRQQPGSNLPSNANTSANSGNTLKRPPPLNPPKKLITTPQEKQETKPEPQHTRGSPVMVFDIPLYSAESNEYLDENGTVTFNLLDLINKAKVPQSNVEGKRVGMEDLKLAKRNRLFDEALIEDNNDVETEEGKTKKKPHPMKGKSLIGKYDIDDPFIDDSELLWEEQRALAEDGFFVFFGPLVASSDSGSPEASSRLGGTGHHGSGSGATRKRSRQ